MAAQLKRCSAVPRACWAMRDRRLEFDSTAVTASAKLAQSPWIRASRPSPSARPLQPAGVVTIAFPQAMASSTLMLVPAETSSGTATAEAWA